MNAVSRGALVLGARLGQGGQGTVYTVTNLVINNSWAVVYKEYAPEVLPRLHAGALISMADLLAGLPAEDGRWLAEKTAWPAGVVIAGPAGASGTGETADGPVTGFVMRAVPDQFQFDVQTIAVAGASARRLAGLEFLLNPDAYVGQIGLRISQRDRLLLLADIAATVSRLHSMDIVVGDLSPKNVLFCVPGPAIPGRGPGGDPECFFIDCDAMRLRGADVLPQVETPNWQVPGGEEPATRASDAYKFALLTVRLLARDQDAADPSVLAGVAPELADLARAGLSTDPAARPGPAQWISLLRAVAHDAPVTYTAPVPRPPVPVTHADSGQPRHRAPGPAAVAGAPDRVLSGRRKAPAIAAAGTAAFLALVIVTAVLLHTPPKESSRIQAGPAASRVLSIGKYGITNPAGIAVTGADLWVVNFSHDSVTELNASSGSMVRTLSGGSYSFADPYGVAAVGSNIWVTNRGSSTNLNALGGSLTELNASDGSVVRTLYGGNYDFNYPSALASDGSDIWVTNNYSDSVTELNATDGSLVRTLTGFRALSGIAVADGHIWLVTNSNSYTDGSVTELNASDGSLVRTLSGGKYHFGEPSGIAAVGNHIWVANFYDNSVTELNASDGSLVRTLSGDKYGFESPAGIAGDGSHIWVANADGGSVTELTVGER